MVWFRANVRAIEIREILKSLDWLLELLFLGILMDFEKPPRFEERIVGKRLYIR